MKTILFHLHRYMTYQFGSQSNLLLNIFYIINHSSHFGQSNLWEIRWFLLLLQIRLFAFEINTHPIQPITTLLIPHFLNIHIMQFEWNTSNVFHFWRTSKFWWQEHYHISSEYHTENPFNICSRLFLQFTIHWLCFIFRHL